ncbi:MAG: hypothetical protein H0U49_12475 [Parachlamydiaceae bacterium]|nr:hypothetical protein [Parachlamydiaceae bacterium]
MEWRINGGDTTLNLDSIQNLYVREKKGSDNKYHIDKIGSTNWPTIAKIKHFFVNFFSDHKYKYLGAEEAFREIKHSKEVQVNRRIEFEGSNGPLGKHLILEIHQIDQPSEGSPMADHPQQQQESLNRFNGENYNIHPQANPTYNRPPSQQYQSNVNQMPSQGHQQNFNPPQVNNQAAPQINTQLQNPIPQPNTQINPPPHQMNPIVNEERKAEVLEEKTVAPSKLESAKTYVDEFRTAGHYDPLMNPNPVTALINHLNLDVKNKDDLDVLKEAAIYLDRKGSHEIEKDELKPLPDEIKFDLYQHLIADRISRGTLDKSLGVKEFRKHLEDEWAEDLDRNGLEQALDLPTIKPEDIKFYLESMGMKKDDTQIKEMMTKHGYQLSGIAYLDNARTTKMSNEYIRVTDLDRYVTGDLTFDPKTGSVFA